MLERIQLQLLCIAACLCFFISLFILVIKYQSLKEKKAVLMLEINTALLLIADVALYMAEGKTDQVSKVIVQVSSFLLFFLVNFGLYAFNSYLTVIFMGRTKLRVLPKRLLICFILASVEMSVIAAGHFFGWFYYADELNVYHRGPLFILSFIVPLVVFVIQASVVIQHRNLLSRRVFAGALLSVFFPVTAGISQIFCYGFSLLNLSMGISAIVLFVFSLLEQNDRLLKAANTEYMSGLPNTYGFIREIELKIASGQAANYDAYYFDIVRMSQINKKFGNDNGDKILVLYAETLHKYFFADEVLGRLGGNFFVALIRKENRQKFLDLLKGLEFDYKLENRIEKIRLSAVAGIYEITKDDTIAERILGNTAEAIGLAKTVDRKPVVIFTPERQEELQKRKHLQEIFPQCLQNGEFVPYYQCKVDLQTQRLCGAEALVRWIHDGKIVPPCDFIPMMEENESICKLDFYMLEAVCKDIKRWMEMGLNPPCISVNFSRRNLGNKDLALQILGVLKRNKIPERLVEIEITETIDEHSLETLKGVVEELQSYGIKVAIDDFGTGSSSISVLKEIKFDDVKIDRAFVEKLEENDILVLKCIVQMALAMNANVVTEGVEDREQCKILQLIGCYQIQGFAFDHPSDSASFEKHLEDPYFV